MKFAHAIQKNDLISVPLTLFGNCYFQSHKAFTVMSTWSGRRQNLLWLLNRCRSKQQKTLQELLLLSYRFTMTRVQNLMNVIGGNMDVQVSFDFASAGIYAAQYEVTMVYWHCTASKTGRGNSFPVKKRRQMLAKVEFSNINWFSECSWQLKVLCSCKEFLQV